MVIRTLISSLLFALSFTAFSQEYSDTLDFEAGVSLNRYVPARTDEIRPYFFSGNVRYRWKRSDKLDHFIGARVAGNYNKQISDKPVTSKTYLSFEAGYQGRWRRDSTKIRFSWGISLGVFQIRETISDMSVEPVVAPDFELPFDRNRQKFALTPHIAVEYHFNSLTYLNFTFSMSYGTPYYGDTDHLEFNNWRGFSSQAPSVGICRKF